MTEVDRMAVIRRSEDPIGDGIQAVEDAIAESARRGNISPEDVLGEWIVDLRDQIAGAVEALRDLLAEVRKPVQDDAPFERAEAIIEASGITTKRGQ